jgi:hypothetical protein
MSEFCKAGEAMVAQIVIELGGEVSRSITEAVERFNRHAKTCEICVHSNVITSGNNSKPN